MVSKSHSFLIPINSHDIIPFYQELGDVLRECGHRVEFIPENEKVANSAREYLPTDRIHSDYLTHNPQNELKSLCAKYDIHSARRLVFPKMVYDRAYDTPSRRNYWLSNRESLEYSPYLDLLHKALDYLDRLYENDATPIPIQFQGGEVIRRALQRVAEYHGCLSVRTSFSPVPNAVSFRTGESKEWGPLAEIQYDAMTDEERERAARFRDSLVKDRTLFEGDETGNQSLADSIRRKIRRINQYGTDIAPVAVDWLRRNAAKRVLGGVTRRMYLGEDPSRQFIQSTNYVFYPIQYFRESRVTMRAPQFYDQVWLVEYLSRSLPPGYELVVKDHPKQLGALPLSNARAIKRYATAVAPEIPAREVVEHADAVVTLNNTVGYEALLYGKPVLTLGDAFYSGAGYTQDTSDIGQLHEGIHQAVHAGGLTDREVLEFAHGILEASYDGVWGYDDPENVETFVDSVFEFLNDVRNNT